MSIKIKPEILKQIVDALDSGFLCFYHKTTGELESYPDENSNPGFDEELWADVMEKVDKNRDDYMEFEPMGSHESFRMMENFIAEIEDIPTHNKLIGVISRKRPFANFKNALFEYPFLRERWFRFHHEAYTQYVQDQIDAANFGEEEDND
jgi:hypothetical protein